MDILIHEHDDERNLLVKVAECTYIVSQHGQLSFSKAGRRTFRHIEARDIIGCVSF